MIISPKYKFVFIANPKCGSATIHETLLNCIEDEGLINESTLKLSADKHLSCPELIEQRPQYKNYFKFTFIRNPWHRVLSWYFFSKTLNPYDPNRDTSKISFKDYMYSTHFKREIWANSNQFQYQFTKHCDFIGRTENLQEDFNIVCDKIGIPHPKLIIRNTHLHEHNTRHEHYTEYYDDETIKMVADTFAEDIDHFNFEYGK